MLIFCVKCAVGLINRTTVILQLRKSVTKRIEWTIRIKLCCERKSSCRWINWVYLCEKYLLKKYKKTSNMNLKILNQRSQTCLESKPTFAIFLQRTRHEKGWFRPRISSRHVLSFFRYMTHCVCRASISRGRSNLNSFPLRSCLEKSLSIQRRSVREEKQ